MMDIQQAISMGEDLFLTTHSGERMNEIYR